jgi:flagellar biosynthesis protein FlhB
MDYSFQSLFGMECLVKGEIHYKFNSQNYSTIGNFTEKIKKLVVLIVSRNEFAIGLKYECPNDSAPILLVKEEGNITALIQLCKENSIVVVYNKKICQQIFNVTEIGDTISSIFWKNVATIFAKAIKSRSVKYDIIFINKEKYIVGIKWNKNMKAILIKHSLKNNPVSNIINLNTCKEKSIPIIYDKYMADYLYEFITDKFGDLPMVIQKKVLKKYKSKNNCA